MPYDIGWYLKMCKKIDTIVTIFSDWNYSCISRFIRVKLGDFS